MKRTVKQAPNKKAKDRGRLGAVLAGVGVSLSVFVLYLLTLTPTIVSNFEELDSPVLPVAAYVLGVAQATGYPTYMMLAHLFTYLPFGDVAYRVNLASAFFGALAVAAVYLIGLALTKRPVAAAFGALGFGTTALFWSQAVIAEVYTLNALFMALTVFVLFLWRERREDGYLLLAAFLMGLSMTNHMTSALLLPAGLLFVLLVEGRKKVLDRRLGLKGAGLFLLGLLPYAYLPLRALADPPINVGNPSSLGGFLDLVSGAQFKGEMFAFGPGEVAGRLYAYLVDLSGQFHWAFLVVAVIGAFYLLVGDRAAFALLGSLYFGWLFYALEYDIRDIDVYFIPTYLVLAVFGAVGLGVLFKEVQAFAGGRTPGVRRLLLAALSVSALAIPLLGLGETYRAVDHSGDYEGQRIVDLVDRDTEPGSTVLQLRSPLYYVQQVEGRREDLELISFYEPQNKEEPQSDEEKANRLNAAARGGSLYLLFPDDERLRQVEEAGYQVVPVEEGTLYRAMP